MLLPLSHVARLGHAAGVPWVRALAVLWVAQVVAEIGFSFALPFIPLYVQELGVPDVTDAGLWAGAMAGGFSLTMAAMGPLWGAAADRFGRRLMVQRAMFGACIIIGAMGLVQSPAQLLVLRIVQGAFTGVVAATSTMVSLMAPRRHLGSALGLMHAALFTGASLGPLLGGAFADHYGFRASFAATAAIFLLAGALVTLFVPEPAREGMEQDDVSVHRDGGAVGAPPPLSAPRLIHREILIVIILSAVIRVANMAPQPILPLFVQSLGASPAGIATTVGAVVAASGIASTISALLLGRISDRYGRRATLLVCLLAATALSPLHALVTSVWQLLLLRTALGFALGGMFPAIQAVLTDLTPANRRGTAFGWLATAGALGNGAGPVTGSALAAAFGITASFLAPAPIFLASALLLLILPSPKARTQRGGNS